MEDLKTEMGLKKFLQRARNIIIAMLILLFLTQGYTLWALNKIKRKVDHRYFNITNSLQDIHNVEIETRYGRVKS